MNEHPDPGMERTGGDQSGAETENAREREQRTGDPWAEVKRVQAEFAGRPFSDSSELIREDRDK